MRKLLRGVQQFRDTVYAGRRDEFIRVADGQNPYALFVTCSDSRVDPELLTSSGPGDIFVLRNAGNLIPPYGTGRGGEAATIEYAVSGLGVRCIVVCGHTGCGAMRALLDPASLASLPMTSDWLAHADATRAVVESRYPNMTDGNERWLAAVEENVLVQLEHLKTHPSVAGGLAAGTLTLYGWTFDMRQGLVRSFDPHDGHFLPLPDGSGAEPLPPSVAPRRVIRPSANGNGQS